MRFRESQTESQHEAQRALRSAVETQQIFSKNAPAQEQSDSQSEKITVFEDSIIAQFKSHIRNKPPPQNSQTGDFEVKQLMKSTVDEVQESLSQVQDTVG